MRNFTKSWKNFLSEGAIPEKVHFKDTRYRIKLENKEKILREVTEDEMEHIQKAIDELGPEDLAFNDLFEGKNRLIIDFPTMDGESELGRFINGWKLMGYTVDWSKGIVSSERTLRDTSPEALASELVGGRGARAPQKRRKITMKIGKWFAKLYEYLVKSAKLEAEISAYAQERMPGRRGFTGKDVTEALGPKREKEYYRLKDYSEMMAQYTSHGLGNVNMGMHAQVNTPDKVKHMMRYWQENAAYIKKNLNEAVTDDYSIIITRDPIDIWRMSDFDNIESCHSPPSRSGGGEYYKCAVAEAHGHGAVAYVVKTEELLNATATDSIESAEQEIQEGEIFADTTRRYDEGELEPVSRLRLRQVRYYTHNEEAALLKRYGTIGDLMNLDLPEDEEEALIQRIKRARSSDVNPFEGVQLAVPETRIYGSAIPGFYDRIVKWARERQEPQMERAPRTDDGKKLNLNDFIKFGGTHDDNAMWVLLTGLYGYTRDQADGHIKQDRDTQDNLDLNLVGGLIERYQSELNEISEEFNHRYSAVTVEGTAIDDGADGVYITCDATLRITWAGEDWNKMPGVELIGHGLEELKEYGLGWIKADYPYIVQKIRGGHIWMLPIDIAPENLVGLGGQEYAYDPENYHEFCQGVDVEVDDKREMVKAILSNFFKREGMMKGGGVMSLGRDVVNDNMELYHWVAEAEEGYEIDEYELVQFTAHPEVWYKDLGATEEQAMKIMNDRNFWLEIRKRMAAPAFENTGGQMYPQMPLDMDMFGWHGTEDESQELNLMFSIHDDAPDEQAEVLRNLVEIWDDQEEIDRVANEVFRDMLQGSVNMEGSSIQRGELKEELSALKVERMLKRLII